MQALSKRSLLGRVDRREWKVVSREENLLYRSELKLTKEANQPFFCCPELPPGDKTLDPGKLYFGRVRIKVRRVKKEEGRMSLTVHMTDRFFDPSEGENP